MVFQKGELNVVPEKYYEMKLNTLLIRIRLVALLIFSCTCGKESADWYDVKTDQSLSVPSTLKDFQALLDNAGVMNGGSVGLGEVSSDDHFLSETYTVHLLNNERNAYTWSNTFPYTKVADWQNGASSGPGVYNTIYYCNLILEGLPKLEIQLDPVDKAMLRHIMGQALFQRARCFYEVSQVWASPYHSTTIESGLGIPLRLASDVNSISERSTLKQTYGQIIGDLLYAKDLLPVIPQYKTRASKPAVFALLARAYLSMEEYTLAGKYADSCLQLYNELLDYSTRSTTASMPFEIFNPEVIFHTRMILSYYMTTASLVLIDSNLYKSYENDDLRKSIFFTVNAGTGSVNFKGSYSGIRTAFFSGLATDEVYLIRAECFARAGKLLPALQDLNDLLKKRWRNTIPYVNVTANNAEEALAKILLERRKELLLRGLRWSDLRRLNRDDRFKVTIERNISGMVYTLEPNSYKYTLPLPADVIMMSGMPQNEGWEN